MPIIDALIRMIIKDGKQPIGGLVEAWFGWSIQWLFPLLREIVLEKGPLVQEEWHALFTWVRERETKEVNLFMPKISYL